MQRPHINRRNFLGASAAAVLGSQLIQSTSADDRPPVKRPRATDGDSAFEPNWDEKLTLTVGNKNADLNGTDDKVLQAAVDYVKRLGGGTVKIQPGTFTLRNAVVIPSKIRILGSGPDSIITKGPSESVELAEDSDWYDQEVTLKKSGNFKVGDGVVFQAKNAHTGANVVIKRTLIARSGNRFKISDGLRKNLWLSGKPTVSSLFPLFSSEYTADVTIENLTFDGNRKNNVNFNGNYGGCVFLQDCNRYSFINVTTRNYNGDGISFQICHDVKIENCHSHDNADLGVHPGSGSQRPLLLNNKLERNGIGIFWCWGVKYGLAEGNHISGNRNYGISIGHNDTDNVMKNNDVIDSGKVGILFRDDPRGQDFWANRNLIENNRITNSGDAEGIAIDVRGETKSVTLKNNKISETRAPMKRIGIRIAKETKKINLVANQIEGFAVDVQRMS